MSTPAESYTVHDGTWIAFTCADIRETAARTVVRAQRTDRTHKVRVYVDGDYAGTVIVTPEARDAEVRRAICATADTHLSKLTGLP